MTPRALGVLLLLACTGASGVHAQLVLRFEAQPGETVGRLFQVHTRVTEESMDGAQRVRELAKLGRLRGNVLAVVDSRVMLHVVIDSLVVRQRTGDGPWSETPSLAADSLWVQMTVDPRLSVTRRVGHAADPEGPLVQQLVTGYPGLLLPMDPVRPGRRWSQDIELRADEVTGGAIPGQEGAILPVRLIASVDSVVPRSLDTLAYVSVSGAATPTTVRRPDGVTIQFAGNVAGSLIWSSGWRMFVAGATKTSVVAELGVGDRQTRFMIDTTFRHAVAPEP